MTSIDEYLATYADSHPRANLDAQLRASGHSTDAIMAAWYRREATRQAASMHAAPALPTSHVLTTTRAGGGIRGLASRQPLVVVLLVAAIGLTIAVAGFGVDLKSPLSFTGTSSATRIPDEDIAAKRATRDRDVLDELAETDSDIAEANDAIDTYGDASASFPGGTPDGFTKQRDGMWLDETTGSSIIVTTVPTYGLDFGEVTDEAIKTYATESVEITNGPKSTSFGDHDAIRIDTSVSSRGLTANGRQYFVDLGDDIAIVTLTYGMSTDSGDRADIDDAARTLEFS